MKIAIVSSLDKPTLKESKGGIETWTANFVLESAKRGNNIDLYAVKGSITTPKINIIQTLNKPLPEYYIDDFFDNENEFSKRKEQFMSTVYTKALMQIKENENDYDLIIDSCSYPPFTYNTGFFNKPVIIIQHFPTDFSANYYLKNFGINNNMHFVFPSKYQAQRAEFIFDSNKTVIAHGIDINDFKFNDIGSDNMVWMSRFHMRTNKGLKEAITAANHVKKNLKVFTMIEPSAKDFFHNNIEPLLSQYIQINQDHTNDLINSNIINKNEIFGISKLFLFPIQWEEPFGIVMIESMATGTPVIAFARGSVPEIIKDGVTGYIVNPSDTDTRGDWIIKKTGIDGICDAIEKIYSMSDKEYKQMRINCRTHIEDNFKINKMVDNYDRLFENIIAEKYKLSFNTVPQNNFLSKYLNLKNPFNRNKEISS